MVELFENSDENGQTPRSVASDLGLHCLPVTRLGISSLQWVKENFYFNTDRFEKFGLLKHSECQCDISCSINLYVTSQKDHIKCFFVL